jgi:single-stranded-DNA-specific exonuclease
LSVKFLLEDDEYTAEILAKELIKTNNERKRLCNKIVEEIKSLCVYDKKYTFLFNENWHLGVLGIVASKCIDIKYCPTIIMTKFDENTLVGSARSVKDVDIYSLFEKCKDDLINFGGHKMAVGFKLQRNKIEEFRQHFEEEVERSVSIDNLTPTINVDFKIDLKKITKDLFYTLQQFEPFGIGNENPIFASEIVCKRYSIEYNNIVINFVENNIKYYGIGYNLNDKEYILRNGKKFLLIYSYKNIVADDIILNVHDIVDVD